VDQNLKQDWDAATEAPTSGLHKSVSPERKSVGKPAFPTLEIAKAVGYASLKGFHAELRLHVIQLRVRKAGLPPLFSRIRTTPN